jgi:hypothetical protein
VVDGFGEERYGTRLFRQISSCDGSIEFFQKVTGRCESSSSNALTFQELACRLAHTIVVIHDMDEPSFEKGHL